MARNLNNADLVAAGYYDARKNAGVNLINLKPSNTLKLRTGMAAASRGIRNSAIMVLGSSGTRGQGRDTPAATAKLQAQNAWPAQAARFLSSRGIPTSSDGVFGTGGNWGLAAGAANFMSGDGRVVLAGNAAGGSLVSFGGNAFQTSATTDTITFTPVNPVTDFLIYMRNGTAGRNLSYAIDGGAATVVNSTTGTGPLVTAVTGLSSGTHAIQLSWASTSTSTPLTIPGVIGFNNASGRREIMLYNGGICGAQSSQLLNANATDGGAGLNAMRTAIAPDCTIIDNLGINDWRNSVPVATFRTNVDTIISEAKAVGDVIVSTPVWDSATSGNSAQQDDYVAALVAAALAADVPILDNRTSLVSAAAMSGAGLVYNGTHLEEIGYAVRGNFIGEALHHIASI